MGILNCLQVMVRMKTDKSFFTRNEDVTSCTVPKYNNAIGQ